MYCSGTMSTTTSGISPGISSASSNRSFFREESDESISEAFSTTAGTDTSPFLSRQTQLHLWAYLFNQNTNHDHDFEHPKCKKCGDRTVLDLNGHGRPFYRCVVMHKANFACYADLLGYDAGNPVCLCGQPSRVNYNTKGDVFYTCVTGGCGLFRFKR